MSNELTVELTELLNTINTRGTPITKRIESKQKSGTYMVNYTIKNEIKKQEINKLKKLIITYLKEDANISHLRRIGRYITELEDEEDYNDTTFIIKQI